MEYFDLGVLELFDLPRLAPVTCSDQNLTCQTFAEDKLIVKNII